MSTLNISHAFGSHWVCHRFWEVCQIRCMRDVFILHKFPTCAFLALLFVLYKAILGVKDERGCCWSSYFKCPIGICTKTDPYELPFFISIDRTIMC